MKRRFVFLPTPNSQIVYSDLGSWQFPVGTVIIKEFFIYSDLADPTSPVIPLETRFLVRKSSTDWETYSYQWNTEGTDAILREESFETEEITTFNVTNSLNPQQTTYEHIFPSRSQCFQCHQGTANEKALGLNTFQLNNWYQQSESIENQIAYLQRHQLLDGAPISSKDISPPIPSPFNSSQTLQKRVKSYLEGNCAHCHNSTLHFTCGDHRFETDLINSGICNQLTPGSPQNPSPTRNEGQPEPAGDGQPDGPEHGPGGGARADRETAAGEAR